MADYTHFTNLSFVSLFARGPTGSETLIIDQNGAFQVAQVFVPGTAAAPGIVFTGEADTGLFLKAANSIGFSGNGAEIGSYSSSGAWSFGPAAGNSQAHNFLGRSITLTHGAASSAFISIISSSTGDAVIDLACQSTGDPYIYFNGAGVGSAWSLGVDNSASDAFVLSAGGALGTSNAMSVSASGVATFPTGLVGKGTATNDSAAAGIIGEVLATNLATASAVSLSTGTAATVITQSLTAGDWEVDGIVVYKPGASTSITIWAAALSATTNAVPAIIGQPTSNEVLVQQAAAAFVPGANDTCVSIPPIRVSLSATTNVFLVAKATFSVSTLAAYGGIRARRLR